MKCGEKVNTLNVRRFQTWQWVLMAILYLTMLLWIPGVGYAKPATFGVADLAAEVGHSVVNIYTTQVIRTQPMRPDMYEGPFKEFFQDFFGNQPPTERKANALGSGFIISKDGLILTNNHVVGKAEEIKVRLDNDRAYDAKIVGTDPKTDLALIKVEPDSAFPPPVRMGDSDAMRVGDGVMAVGNPFGLGHTVTTGILSAKGRIIGAGPYDDFLQTDAAINPGNSGGPLFNLDGEVIGINTAIVAGGQGIGFAIPINVATDLLSQLKTGKVVRGWLGVVIQDVTDTLAKSFGLDKSKGVIVSQVMEDGPAQKAGLQRGDVILEMEGKPVEDSHDLSRRVAATKPGTRVELKIVRNDSRKTLTIPLGTLPDEKTLRASTETTRPDTKWGMHVQDLTPQLAQRLGLSPDESGVLISQVQPGSPADEAGLQRGDLIKEVDRTPVESLSDFTEALSENQNDQLLLLVRRGQGALYVVLTR